MWQRFTERSRKVIFDAQEEARLIGSYEIDTEHLLLGLIRETDNVACRVLDRTGVKLNQIRTGIKETLPHGEVRNVNEMHLAPRAKRVIDLAYDEARRLNNNYIGTEHLLLGIIREDEGMGAQVLKANGVILEQVRSEVQKLQGNGAPPQYPNTSSRLLLSRVSWGMWWIGAILVGASWFGAVPYLVGWVGFILTFISSVISVVINKYWRFPMPSSLETADHIEDNSSTWPPPPHI